MTHNTIKKMQEMIEEWKIFAVERCPYNKHSICQKLKTETYCNMVTCPGGDDK